MNPMRNIRIEKVTLNIGAGTNQDKLEKGIKLIHHISGKSPVKTFTTKRIPTWNVRPGLALGCKLTLRKKHAHEILGKLLEAKDRKLSPKQFDQIGNLAFGVHEYIDIPGVKYNHDIGIMGFEVCVTLERPGYRVKRRRVRKSSLSKKHIITKEEAMDYLKNEFKVVVS